MVSEFKFIENLRSKYSLDKIGDDCAVLPKDTEKDLLLTADMLVEDIDFRLEWTTPEFLGHKALAVSLSDIAAMGGTPKWAMLSIGVPESVWNSEFVERFCAGWLALADEFGTELVGGDISRSPDRLVIDSIVGGEVPKGKAILRSGAKPGDSIFVTGSLGDAAGGLKLLEVGNRYSSLDRNWQSNLIIRQLQPQPKISTLKLLQINHIITSMIDVSDGLSSDLGHICHESKVGARIYSERLPINPDLSRHFPSDDCIEMALHGGEDFELLFTVSPQYAGEVPGTCIGEITDNGLEIVENGTASPLLTRGYQHFD
jgi:thiamine-monophosphate kinase